MVGIRREKEEGVATRRGKRGPIKESEDPLALKGATAIQTGQHMAAVRTARRQLSTGRQPSGFRKSFKEEHGIDYPYETPMERQTRQRSQMRRGEKPTVLRIGQRRAPTQQELIEAGALPKLTRRKR